MLATAEFREEREELQALISSGIFHRAPHLLSFLTYVCERSFQGQGDQIKEYTIGVEAFRRLPDFDPKKDSIVRVEAHRLRRRRQPGFERSRNGRLGCCRYVIARNAYRCAACIARLLSQ